MNWPISWSDINAHLTETDARLNSGLILPVVKLDTTFAGGVYYTPEENALLKATWAKKTPIVINCDITLGTTTYTDTYFTWGKINARGDATILGFTAALGTTVLFIMSIDDGETWYCNIPE